MGKYGKGITVQGAGRDFYVRLVKERGGDVRDKLRRIL